MADSLLRFVTITGADDAVDPAALIELSARFPFVEFGLLHSAKRAGEPRYPSKAWLDRFALAVEREGFRPCLSVHLCGAQADAAMAGDDEFFVNMPQGVRIQLNSYLETPKEWPGGQSALQKLGARSAPLEIILQVGGPQTLITATGMAMRSANFSALYDPSGGRGIRSEWPKPGVGTEGSMRNLRLGYAGGISPDNVEAVLRDIYRHGRDFWIDMETGVRTDNAFDLLKVRVVLETTERVMKQVAEEGDRDNA